MFLLRKLEVAHDVHVGLDVELDVDSTLGGDHWNPRTPKIHGHCHGWRTSMSPRSAEERERRRTRRKTNRDLVEAGNELEFALMMQLLRPWRLLEVAAE